MRDEYDIMSLNPRKNPYTKRLRQQITININHEAVAYFKAQSADAEPKGLMTLGLRRPVATGQAWRLQGPDERDWQGISAMLSPDRMLACVWVSSAGRAPFSKDGLLDEPPDTCLAGGTTLRWVRHGNWPQEASGVMHFSSHPDA